MTRTAPLFGLAAALLTAATPITGPVTNPANDHAYYLLSQDTWTNSEAEAVALGGHLATINDADENQWVFDTFASFNNVDRNLWIGLNDADEEGTFVWSSGEAVTYTNWDSGQPDNTNGIEDYAHLWAPNAQGGFTANNWNDLDDRDSFAFAQPTPIPLNGVVEIIPEPASAASLLVGSLAMLIGRRRRTA